MRDIPVAMQAHLDGGTTTLARCWKLTRSDGAVQGFTDHDEPLAFDGVTYDPGTGFQARALDSASGLAADNTEAIGALSSDAIRESDLERGVYDGSEVDILLVNWTDPGQRVLLFRGTLGETTRGPLSFAAELRGMAHQLDQPMGRAFLRQCDAELGDARCGVTLTSVAGAVTEVASAVELTTTLDADGFARGLLTWTGGANAGTRQPVREQSGARLGLWSPPADPVAAGDTFEITPGCDKTLATCRDRFDNEENFRGFPHMPGDDFAVSYPNRGEDNDGGAL